MLPAAWAKGASRHKPAENQLASDMSALRGALFTQGYRMSSIRAFCNRSFTLGQCFAWLGLALVLGILGAHFYRAGEYGVTLCVGGMILFLCCDSAWKRYAVAFFLFWGMLEWGDSALALARTRMQMGMPWMRGAAILLAVGLTTGLAGCHAYARARERDAKGSTALFQGVVYIACFLTLFYLRQSARMEFLLLERYLPVFGSVQIFAAAWYGAFLGGKLVDPKTTRRFRRIAWIFFGLVFFAQFFLGVLGVKGMLMTGKLHAPIPACIVFAPIFRDSMSMMPIIVLAATLLTGGVWCSMFCYFGPFDSLAAGVTGTRPLPAWMVFLFRRGRALVLVTGSLAAFVLRAFGVGAANAVAIAVAYGILSLLIMAVFSRRYRAMAHCAAFCPMGLVVSLLGRLSPWRVCVRTESCDNCGACEKICSYRAINHESRAGGKTLPHCALCRDCITVCRNRALFIRFPGLSPGSAWIAFAGLTTVLHVIFFSVAMV